MASSTTCPSKLSKRVALVTAYKAYCRWDAARSFITQKNKNGKTGVSKKRTAITTRAQILCLVG